MQQLSMFEGPAIHGPIPRQRQVVRSGEDLELERWQWRHVIESLSRPGLTPDEADVRQELMMAVYGGGMGDQETYVLSLPASINRNDLIKAGLDHWVRARQYRRVDGEWVQP